MGITHLIHVKTKGENEESQYINLHLFKDAAIEVIAGALDGN